MKRKDIEVEHGMLRNDIDTFWRLYGIVENMADIKMIFLNDIKKPIV